MRKNDVIHRKLAFLIDSGFSYDYHHDGGLFFECMFDRGLMHVSISYDCHNEFLDLKIKNGTTTVLETSYAQVVVDLDQMQATSFASQLKAIYLMFPNSFSLNNQQIELLLELYMNRIRTISCMEE